VLACWHMRADGHPNGRVHSQRHRDSQLQDAVLEQHARHCRHVLSGDYDAATWLHAWTVNLHEQVTVVPSSCWKQFVATPLTSCAHKLSHSRCVCAYPCISAAPLSASKMQTPHRAQGIVSPRCIHNSSNTPSTQTLTPPHFNRSASQARARWCARRRFLRCSAACPSPCSIPSPWT
jgi:hypothetical protein